MKNIRFLTFVLTIATLALSACGAATATQTAAPEAAVGAKVEAMPVAFVGIIDSIAGDQWVISGTTVTVDASIVRDGPFDVGDQVKVEGFVNPDGSFTVSRVENPTPRETATLPPLTVDNSNEAISNANTNDANINDDNSNDANINDDNSNDSNSNDDDSSNTNDDNSNDDDDGNTNDDNSNDDDDNSNDDGGGNSNDDNGNDDHGGNSNDDDGDDDSGSGGNGNDD